MRLFTDRSRRGRLTTSARAPRRAKRAANASGRAATPLILVETLADYVHALVLIGKLMDAKPAHPHGEALIRAQTILIAEYDRRTRPELRRPPDPIAEIERHIKLCGLRFVQVNRMLCGHASAVLRRKRPPTAGMALRVHKTLGIPLPELMQEVVDAAAPEPYAAPAVPVERSVRRAYVVCLACGAKRKSLKRHIKAAHGMTRAQYRRRWGLPPDYALVAPESSRRYSLMMKKRQRAEAERRKARGS